MFDQAHLSGKLIEWHAFEHNTTHFLFKYAVEVCKLLDLSI